MPQFSGTFTINDGSATPVAVAFSPELLSSAQTVLVDRREASRDLQPSIEQVFDRATAARPTYKVGTNVLLPIVRTVNGVVVAKRPIRIRVLADLPTEATAQERAHAFAFAVNAAQHAMIKAGYTALDPLY